MLGAPTQPGGEHLTQGTHNRLIRLGDDQYLELISINPVGERPTHPRWFDLDKHDMQRRIAVAPKLITWAVRVSNIEQVAEIPPYDRCDVQSLRRGDLRWKVALTPGGRLMEGGILPLTIEWQVDRIPPYRLPASGCEITEVVIQHPDPELIQGRLIAMGLSPSIPVHHGEKAQLIVDLHTPKGAARLCSSG